MKPRVVVISLLALSALTGDALAGRKSDARVYIVNHSSYAIHQLFLSATSDTEWGPDQLKDATIESGESFTLRRIPCDRYDIRLIDEDQDPCVIRNVPLCADADRWEITDQDLLACQAASR